MEELGTVRQGEVLQGLFSSRIERVLGQKEGLEGEPLEIRSLRERRFENENY